MNRALTLIISALLISSSLLADTKIPVIADYKKAGEKRLWRPTNIIPAELIKFVTIPTPSKALQNDRKDIFFQNEKTVVCYRRCELNQPQIEFKNGKDFIIPIPPKTTNGEILNGLKLANVYYWLEKLYQKVAEIAPTLKLRKLTVRVDVEQKSITSGVKLSNNAFYNPIDHSLNFLESKTLFIRLTDSALDPSVVIHEAAHAIFSDLFSLSVNNDISGLNEGFADYMAQIILEDNVIGRVFTRGKSLRDGDNVAIFTRRMKPHDQGEAFQFALHKIRELYSNKLEADRVLFNFINILGTNQLSTIDRLADIYLYVFDRMNITTPDSFELREEIDNIFAMTGLISYNDTIYKLPTVNPTKERALIRIKQTVKLPKEIAETESASEEEEISVGLINMIPASENPFDYLWIKLEINGKHIYGNFWLLLDKNLNLDELTKLILSGDLTVALSSADILLVIDAMTGQILNTKEELTLKSILELSNGISTIFSWYSELHKNSAFLVSGKDAFMKSKEVTTSSLEVLINGKTVNAMVITAKTKTRWYMYLLDLLFAKDTRKELTTPKAISVILVNKKELGIEKPIIEIGDENSEMIAVGYEVTYQTGVTERVLIDRLSEQK